MASDRELAIQEVRNLFPGKLSGGNDAFVTTQFPGQVMFAERAIKAERERDEAAQLPIAPATEVEKQQYLRDCEDAESPGSADTVYSPLYRFISRRNSPPKIDSLVETIVKVLHDHNVSGNEQVTVNLAEAIAVAIRRDDNG